MEKLPDISLIATVLSAAGWLISLLLGWFLRSLFSRIKNLENMDIEIMKSTTEIRVLLPTQFVTKEEVNRNLDLIFSALRRLEDKIDHTPSFGKK